MDIIYSCLWKSQPCGPENFTTQFTDFGVCYVFNGDGDNPLYTETAGKKNGKMKDSIVI